MTYDINDMNLEVDINVSLPLGTMLALTHPHDFKVPWVGTRKTQIVIFENFQISIRRGI